MQLRLHNLKATTILKSPSIFF